MTVHLQRQIDRLKDQFLSLGQRIERAVDDAIRAVLHRDAELAQRVINEDDLIDRLEVDVEEECLHTLALHQPVAFDLRYVIAVLKINNDLERIGDHAVSIAQQAAYIAGDPLFDDVPSRITEMASRVRHMLKLALEALVRVDTDRAQEVRLADDEVDELHRGMYDHVADLIQDNPARTPQYLHLITISRQLERIADLTVNIAEDVIYMSRGDIARHRGGLRPSKA